MFKSSCLENEAEFLSRNVGKKSPVYLLTAPGDRSYHSKLIIILPFNFGDTNKYTILHSIYTLYLTPPRFGIVAIFNDLTPKFH